MKFFKISSDLNTEWRKMCRKAKKQMTSSHKKLIYYKKLKDVETK